MQELRVEIFRKLQEKRVNITMDWSNLLVIAIVLTISGVMINDVIKRL